MRCDARSPKGDRTHLTRDAASTAVGGAAAGATPAAQQLVKSSAFQFKVVLGFVEVLKAQAQDMVRQQCSYRQHQMWSLLHPRQLTRASASACGGVHLTRACGLLPVPVMEFYVPVPVVSQSPAPVDDFISPAPAAVQLPTPSVGVRFTSAA